MTVENDMLVIQRQEQIENRNESLKHRADLLKAYERKEISLKELKCSKFRDFVS